MTTDDLIRCSVTVLERVFSLKVLSSQLMESIPPCEDEQILASLRFTGDYTGHVWVRLSREHVSRCLGYIHRSYGMAYLPPEQEVFAELMNMYAANMATELLRFHVRLDIGTPNHGFPTDMNVKEGTLLSIVMRTEHDLQFNYTYWLEPEGTT